MLYKTILALDPSGSFYEGKGTTGWCLFNCNNNQITTVGSLRAKDYTDMCAYWQAHLDLIEQYYHPGTIIVCEDYLLYAHKAAEQTNSRMETPKVIGCIQLFCWQKNIPYYMQTAGEVKPRWTNEILHYKGFLKQQGRRYVPVAQQLQDSTHHSLDAIRHAVHYATFRNKEKRHVQSKKRYPASRTL